MLLTSWIESLRRPRRYRHRNRQTRNTNRHASVHRQIERLEYRTLLTAALIDGRVVTVPTPLNTNGEVAALPDNESFVGEFDTFFVELYVATPDVNEGVASASVDLRYNTSFVSPADIAFGPAFINAMTVTTNDAAGFIDNISGTTSTNAVGRDNFALLARIRFDYDAAAGTPADPNGGLFNLGVLLSDGAVELVDEGDVITQNALLPRSELFSVPYDFNDDGKIDFGDFAVFAGVFRDAVNSSASESARLADFNSDGVVDFGDFSFFAANFRQTRASSVSLVFPDNYAASRRPPGNQPPSFAPVGDLTATPGGRLEVQLSATDPDGQAVLFSLLSNGPLPKTTISSKGVLAISPTPAQVGSFNFTLVASDGFLQVSQEVTLTVESDVETTTRVSGRVQNVDEEPLAGIRVTLLGFETTTDVDGQFQLDLGTTKITDDDTLNIHGEDFPGSEVYPFVAERLKLLLDTGPFDNVNNAIPRTIFLPALDVAGGTAIVADQDTMVEQEILPGQMASVEVVAGTLEDQAGNPFTGVLSITQVPNDLTPAALPANLSPDTVVTIQPGDMVFTQAAPLSLPNRAGFPPGTVMDLWSINPLTGEFDNVGVGRVSDDGLTIETIDGGIRNSSWHFFAPPTPDPIPPNDNERTPDEKCNSCKAGVSGNSEVLLHSGVLLETHELVGYQSQGVARGLTLNYDSLRADPRPIVHFGFEDTTGRNRMFASLTVNNGDTALQLPGFDGTVNPAQQSQFASILGAPQGSHFWSVNGGSADGALQADLSSQPSGRYTYRVDQGLGNGQSVVPQDVNGDPTTPIFVFNGSSSGSLNSLISVNSIDSPFGSGWGLGGLQQLVENTDGSVLLIDGDGTASLFEPMLGTLDQFESPAGDFSTLARLANGTFRRTLTDQTVFSFNDNHMLASVVDRNGNETQYIYNGADQLERVLDPVGLQTVLTYTSGRVTSITGPAGRETVLSYDTDGNLTRIVDPDGAARAFEYDDLHHMTGEITPRGLLEEITYGFHGRVTSLTREDGSQLTFDTVQVQGLLSPEATANPIAPPSAITASAAVASYTNANGDVIQTTLDQAGQQTVSVDEIGATSQTTRNSDNLATTITDARGNQTLFTYDNNGNVVSIVDSISLTGIEFNDELDPFATVVVDLNNDGNPDIVTANVSDSNSDSDDGISILLGNGDNTFGVPTSFNFGDDLQTLAAGDVDGDGNADLVLVGSDSVAVVLGNGNGAFGTATEYAVGNGPNVFMQGGGISSVVLQDVNGDTALDIVTTNSLDDSVSILLNNHDGTFPGRVERTGDDPLGHVVVDLNADGLLDVITANADSGSGSISVLLGTAGSEFQPRMDFSLNPDRTTKALTVGDVDGDGDVDVIVASRSSSYTPGTEDGTVSVFLGNGSGSFTLIGNTDVGSNVSPTSVAAGYFDADGNLDAIVGSTALGSQLLFLKGNGDGTFAAPVSVTTPHDIGRIVVDDVNGDGKLDVLAAREFSDSSEHVSVILGNGNGTFAPATTITLTDGGNSSDVRSMRVADLDENGTLDLIAVLPDETVVLSGNGDGTFAVPQRFSGDNPKSVAIGDVDNDGDLDVVTSEYSYPMYLPGRRTDPESRLSVVLGNGDGTFVMPVAMSIDGRFDELSLVDLNGDGDLDATGINRIGNRVLVLTGDGNGHFNAADSRNDFPVTEAPRAIAVGDIDGDGDTDVVVAGSSSTIPYYVPYGYSDANTRGGISVLLGNGDGTLTQSSEMSVATGVLAVSLGDLDGDGNLDLATMLAYPGRVGVFLGVGDGTFLPRREYQAEDDANSLTLLDTDADGDLDIVTANGVENSVSVLANNGDGTFPNLVLHTGRNPESVRTADLNGDGVLDLVTSNSISGGYSTDLGYTYISSLSVILGNPDGTYQSTIDVPVNIGLIEEFVLGDVDGDGKLDAVLALGGVYGSSLAVMLGNGDGTFGVLTEYASSFSLESVALQDMNGDGDLDIVSTNSSDDTVSILLNDGDGKFPGKLERTGFDPRSEVLIDLNGDGNLDVVVANVDVREHSVSVLLGNSDETFQPRMDFDVISGGLGSVSSIAVGDINGDGERDIAAVTYNVFGGTGTSFSVLLGVGDGTFLLATELELPSSYPSKLLLGDFDEDGNLDAMISTNEMDMPILLLLGNGDGTFADATSVAVSTIVGDIVTAYVDDDSHLDLVAAPAAGSTGVLEAIILLGNGDGTFAAELPAVLTMGDGSTSTSVSSLQLADLDGDTVLDLIAALSDAVVVLPGVGDGTFEGAISTSANNLLTLAVGDVDGDGDLDIAVTSNPSSQTLLSVALNNGDRTFAPAILQSLDEDVNDLELGDLNGDGNLDAVGTAGFGYESRLVVFLGDGTGSLAQLTPRIGVPVGDNPRTSVFGDIDDDGNRDIVTVNSGSTSFSVSVLLGNGDGSIRSNFEYAVGAYPTTVNLADVDNDGDLDIVTSSANDDTASVLFNDGNGGFPGRIEKTGPSPVAHVVADLNGDGNLDVATANLDSSDSSISVLLGNADDSFQPRMDFSVGMNNTTRSLTAGFVNGDGVQDLVVVQQSNSTGEGLVTVLLGNGDGTFAAGGESVLGNSVTPTSVTLADLDGDGKLDAIAGSTASSARLRVLPGNGDGTFGSPMAVSTSVSVNNVLTADLNGDGELDLLAVPSGETSSALQFGVLLGFGDGTFATEALVSLTPGGFFSMVKSLRLADFDGNGTPDVVAVLSDDTVVLSGNGDGTFATAVSLSITDGRAVAVGDVDGDGDLDIAASTFAASNSYSYSYGQPSGISSLAVLLGNGDGTFALPIESRLDRRFDDLSLGDVDIDGTLDAVGMSSNGDRIAVVLGNGAGVFAPFMSRTDVPAGKNPRAIAVGDLDGDGDLDLVSAGAYLYNSGTGGVSVILNQGGTTFAAATDLGVSGGGRAVELPDLDGDGNLDIVVLTNQNGRPAVLLGQGDGSFQPGREYVAGDSTDSLTVIDVNGDGAPDIVTSTSDANRVDVLHNDGNGVFPNLVVHTGSNPNNLRIGDLNGDGHADLVTSGAGNFGSDDQGQLSILLGNANGTFQSVIEVPFIDDQIRDFALFDANGDGDLDVALSIGQGGLAVVSGNGNVTFGQLTMLAFDSNAQTVLSGDINDDGNSDLLTLNADSSVSVILGNGNGTFERPTDYATGLIANSIRLADVDGDGDLDIVTANSNATFSSQSDVVDGSVTVLLNDGNGLFQGRIERTGEDPDIEVVVDVNGDSRLDVITANTGSQNGGISVLLGNQDGTFQPKMDFATDSGRRIRSFTVGYVNDDAIQDVLTVSDDTQSNAFLTVLLGAGDGSFSQSGEFNLPVSAPRTVELGDLNEDGKLDAVVGIGQFGVGLQLLLGNGDGTFGAAVGVDPAGAGKVLVGDVNGDTHLDLLSTPAYNATNPQARVILGNGDGTFGSAITAATSGSGASQQVRSIRFADVNGDSTLDLVTALQNEITVIAGNGDGTFGTPLSVSSDDRFRSVAVGDVDGDGDIDLISSNYSDTNYYYIDNAEKNLSVLLGDGGGAFSIAGAIPVDAAPNDLALADLDGDGDLDVVGAVRIGNRIGVGLGTGTGSFIIVGARIDRPSPVHPHEITSGDIDGDGNLDLVMRSGFDPDQKISVLLGNGDTTFNPGPELAMSFTGDVQIALGDLDGDGDLDVTVASINADRFAVFLNQGGGTFAPRREYVGGDGMNSLDLLDLDGDNDLDVVTANISDSTISLIPNNGDGTFPNPVLYTGRNPRSIATGDLDGNGVQDILTGNRSDGSVSFISGNADGTFQSTIDVSIAPPITPAGTIFTYDPVFNQLTSITDELGHRMSFAIDPSNGNVLSSTQVVGLPDSTSSETDDVVTSFTYTAAGLLDTVTDPLGRMTDNDYDTFGRLVTVTSAVGTADEAVQRFEYDAAGNQTATIDGNGNRTTFQFSLRNRVTRITETDPDGGGPLVALVTSFVYDAVGNVVRTTDAQGNIIRNIYDLQDRLIRSTDANNAATFFTYDDNGNLTSTLDPVGLLTTNVYDARDRLTRTIDPGGGITRFGYDLDDNLTSVTDAVGNTSMFAYDARDRLVSETDPFGNQIVNEYDMANNLTNRNDRNERTTIFVYDNLNRLINETWLDTNGVPANVVSYAYDKAGNLTSAADGFSTLTFAYDNLDRTSTVNNTGTPDVPNVVLTYTYDDVGNVLSVTDAIGGLPGTGATTSYQYDGLNRLVQLDQTGNNTSDKRVDFTFNVLGQAARINRFRDLAGAAPVVNSLSFYDNFGRLSDVWHNNGGPDLAFYVYGYDAAGRLDSVQDIDGATSYVYDSRDQLTVANHIDPANPDETYTFDANGNRITSSLHGSGYVTGPGNRLLSDGTFNYGYDNEGNMVRKTEIATGDFTEFEWDHRNRLTATTDKLANGTAIQRVEFTYDAFDRRISQSVDPTPADGIDDFFINYVYDREDVILDFTDSDGHVGGNVIGLEMRYLHGPGVDQVLAQDDGSNNVQWLLTDHLGTTRDLVANNNGTIINHIKYDSFGNIVDQLNPLITTRFLFTGREFDSSTDLYFYRARYYDASIGRFISEDPLRLDAGDANTFRYVANQVTRHVDPFGLITYDYSQSTGQLTTGANPVGIGYSGTGTGRNSPAQQGTVNVGPIPIGEYTIGDAYNSNQTGPNTIPLNPTDATRRNFPDARDPDSFRIHGNNAQNDASQGCIILPPVIRTRFRPGDSIRVLP